MGKNKLECDIKESLSLSSSESYGSFTINKPKEWDLENVELEIREYDYDSTKISIEDLRMLHKYIGDILKYTENKIK